MKENILAVMHSEKGNEIEKSPEMVTACIDYGDL